jgi:hypothetical protein
MAYTRTTWVDYPNTTTPITAASLNNIETGLDAVDATVDGFTGAWTSFSPVITQSTTPTQTINRARFIKVGRIVTVHADISIGSGTSGTSGQTILFNFSGACTAAAAEAVYGGFRLFDSGVTNYVGFAVGASTTTASFFVDGYGANHGQQPIQLTNGDRMMVWLTIEAAS